MHVRNYRAICGGHRALISGSKLRSHHMIWAVKSKFSSTKRQTPTELDLVVQCTIMISYFPRNWCRFHLHLTLRRREEILTDFWFQQHRTPHLFVPLSLFMNEVLFFFHSFENPTKPAKSEPFKLAKSKLFINTTSRMVTSKRTVGVSQHNLKTD